MKSDHSFEVHGGVRWHLENLLRFVLVRHRQGGVDMQAARVSPQARWASLRRKPSGQLQLSPRSIVLLCGPANGVRRRRKPAKEKIVIHRHSAERGSEIRRRGAPRRRHRRTRRAAHGVVVSLRAAADGRQRIHLPSSLSSPSDSPTPSARSTSNQQGHR
jgi:hypothetical protein